MLRAALAAAAALLVLGVCAAQEPVNFYVLGDWGASAKSNAKHQKHVAETMAALAPELAPQFMINVGDNFYESGVESTTDAQWTSKWLDYYVTPETPVSDLLWYSVLGNHDYIDNPQAEVEYSQQGLGGGRWIMPSRYYTKTFVAPSGMTMHFVFIDTIMLANATVMKVAEWEVQQRLMTPGNLGRLADNMRAEAAVNPATQQLQWLEETLAASTADWLFVVGHFPVYSAGGHGNTPELQEQVKPLLEKYNVDAYFSGHAHTLQALYSDGVHYYLSGAGCKDEAHKLKSLPQLLWGDAQVHGFASASVNATTLSVAFYDDHSNLLQTVQQHRRIKL